VIGDVVNLVTHGRLAGEPVYLVIKFTTALTGTGSVVFSLETSTAESFSSKEVLVVSPTITKDDDIGAGLKPLIIPVNVPYAEQYLRVYATVTGTISAGAVSVMLVLDAQTAGLQKQATDV